MAEVEFFQPEREIKPSTRPMVYVAGPYTPLMNRDRSFNRGIADEYGRQIFRLTQGKVDIFIPHNCHACWEDYNLPEKPNIEYFYEFDLRILDICKVIYMLPLWDKSRGAKIEHLFAVNKGIRVCYSMTEIKIWFDKEFGVGFNPDSMSI